MKDDDVSMGKSIGSGFRIVNTTDQFGRLIVPIEESTKIWQELLKEAKQNRGDFISKCSDVDDALGEVISLYFFEGNFEKGKVFSELILRTGFFSFAQKKKVVEAIIKNDPKSFPTIVEKEKKEFFQKLMNIITDRNILAHGELIVDVKAKKVKISFFNSSKMESETRDLSPEFYKKLMSNIVFVTEYCYKDLIIRKAA